jgi:hypothetical protein
MICRKCGKNQHEIKGWLERVNELGVNGIFECRPSCEANLSPDERVVGAIDSEVKIITRERRLEILQNLGSADCTGCGGQKRPRMSHCRNCYYALPPKMRKALYNGFGDGYEEAFEESLRHLEQLREE